MWRDWKYNQSLGLTQEKIESAAQEWQQLGFFQKNKTFWCKNFSTFPIMSMHRMCNNYIAIYKYTVYSVANLDLQATYFDFIFYPPPPTLYWNWFCIVIWGCFSQNDRFVQNWIQGLLWYHIRSGKLPKAIFVTKKFLETDRKG